MNLNITVNGISLRKPVWKFLAGFGLVITFACGLGLLILGIISSVVIFGVGLVGFLLAQFAGFMDKR